LSDIHSFAKRGEKVFKKLSVASMPDGSEIAVPLVIIRGMEDGPVLSVFGGVHGNEYEGPLAIRKVIEELKPTEMSGTFVAVPVVNVPAFNFSTRINPIDQKNLNRVFPGKSNGTISEKIAYVITEQVIGKSDYVIDLHSMGDGWIETLNLVGYYDLPGELGKKSFELAMSFPIETVYKMGSNIGRLSDASIEKGIPAIGTECTGGGVESNIRIYVTGIKNVMKQLKMIDGDPEGLPEKRRYIRWHEVKTSRGGLLKHYVKIGESVRVGEILAEITDIFNNRVSHLRAPIDGIVCARNVKPVVKPGDMIFILG